MKSISKLVYYSGHGISKPPHGYEILSPKPKINFRDLTTKESKLIVGDWPLHSCGFLGFDCLISTLFSEKLLLLPDGITKELLIISDCCYSGNWCNQLHHAQIPAGYHVTVQASALHNQCAHAGIFAPVLVALQNDLTRQTIMKAFFKEDFNVLTGRYNNLMRLQSPVLKTTRVRMGPLMPVHCVANFNGKGEFYLFDSSVFFWYFADKVGLLAVSRIEERELKFSPELNNADRATNLSVIDPTAISNASLARLKDRCYMPIYRFKEALDTETHELHVHYKNEVGLPVDLHTITIRPVVKSKVQYMKGRKVTYSKLSSPEKAQWDAACKGLLAQTVALFKTKVRCFIVLADF
jgi:hypothetical protein